MVPLLAHLTSNADTVGAKLLNIVAVRSHVRENLVICILIGTTLARVVTTVLPHKLQTNDSYSNISSTPRKSGVPIRHASVGQVAVRASSVTVTSIGCWLTWLDNVLLTGN